MTADISVCPGVDPASENEYQDIPESKGGRCVGVTTLPPSCAECLEIWSLNRPEPSGPHRTVIGIALPLPYTSVMFRYCLFYMCVELFHMCIETFVACFLCTDVSYTFVYVSA